MPKSNYHQKDQVLVDQMLSEIRMSQNQDVWTNSMMSNLREFVRFAISLEVTAASSVTKEFINHYAENLVNRYEEGKISEKSVKNKICDTNGAITKYFGDTCFKVSAKKVLAKKDRNSRSLPMYTDQASVKKLTKKLMDDSHQRLAQVVMLVRHVGLSFSQASNLTPHEIEHYIKQGEFDVSTNLKFKAMAVVIRLNKITSGDSVASQFDDHQQWKNKAYYQLSKAVKELGFSGLTLNKLRRAFQIELDSVRPLQTTE